MTRRHLAILLVIIVIMDAIFIGVVVGATSSPWMGVSVGIGSIVLVWGIMATIGFVLGRVGTWAALRRRYPAPDDVVFDRRARLICLSLGHFWMRVNNGIEAFADESHLHMRIGVPGVGDGRPVSIPWEAVGRIERAPMRQALLDVEGIRLWLPLSIVANELELRETMEAEEIDAGTGGESEGVWDGGRDEWPGASEEIAG